jgi:hypothetical protein
MRRNPRVSKQYDSMKRGRRLMLRELNGKNTDARLEQLGRRLNALAAAWHEVNLANGMPGLRRAYVAPNAAEIRLRLNKKEQ